MMKHRLFRHPMIPNKQQISREEQKLNKNALVFYQDKAFELIYKYTTYILSKCYLFTPKTAIQT